MNHPPPVRWWPAAVIVALGAAVVLGIQLFSSRTGQERFLFVAVVVVFTLVLLLVWLLLLSRLRWRIRLAAVAALALVGVALVYSVRIRGVSGNLVPVLEWRWAEGDRGLAEEEAAGAPVVAKVEAAAYPRFLGPRGDATLPGLQLDRDWKSRPPRQIWRRPIGAGWSAFAIAGGLAVTQEQRGEEELVTAYDAATGDLVWSYADPGRYDTTIAGPGPRATPTIYGRWVLTMGALGRLNALALETGRLLWSRDVLAEHGSGLPEWGKSGSPLVLDGLVVVSVGIGAGPSLAAYNLQDGEPAWVAGSDSASYASPFVATLAGQRQIVIFNRASVAGHDPETGAELWRFPWPAEQPNVAKPVPIGDDLLLVSAGYGIGAKLLRLAAGPDGGLGVEEVWSSPRLKAKFTNVVFYEGSIYGLDDGVLVCLDPKTGERCWKRGRYGHGQVILAGGLLLILTESGELVLVEPVREELRELAKIEVLDGKTWNPPALAGALLVVRNDREAAAYELPLAG